MIIDQYYENPSLIAAEVLRGCRFWRHAVALAMLWLDNMLRAKKERGWLPLLKIGWGAGIRTPIDRSRVGRPTVERHPNTVSFVGVYYTMRPRLSTPFLCSMGS